MKKSLLALAVLGAFAGAASAQSSVTLYGKIDGAFTKPIASKDKRIDDFGGTGGSRLGFKGREDLGNDMAAIFVLEHGFNADTGTQADTARFWNRQAYVGLSTRYGQVTLGRLENGAWDVLSAFDPFGGDGQGALRDVGSTLRTSNYDKAQAVLDVRRLDNAVRYDVSFQGFKLAASIAEATGSEKPYAIGGSYTIGKLFVGAAYEQLSAGDKARLATVGATYDFGFVKLAGDYSDGRDAADLSRKGFLVGATVPYGAFDFKVGYAQSKVEQTSGAEPTYKKASLGAQYKLSKRTKVYADYARIGGDVGANNGIADQNRNGYDIGLSHAF